MYVLVWNGLFLCCFVFVPNKHMKNVAGAQSFLFVPYIFRLATILNETTTHGEYIHTYMHAIKTKRRKIFFLFQGEGGEGEGGKVGATERRGSKYLPPYLPNYLAVLVEEEDISILFFL